MDMETASSEAVSVDQTLVINERLSASTALGGPEPEQSTPSESAIEVNGLDADPLAEKQYHDLEPAVASKAAPVAPSLLSVKQEDCLIPPLTVPEPEPAAAATASRVITTRRSRRLANESVPFKKRKRVLSPELDGDEYLLPDHVQHQVERVAEESSGRRLRPKRASQLAAAVEIENQSPDDRDPDWSANCSSVTELKLEPVTDDGPVSGGEPEVIAVPPPRRKRGRPRKSQAPQRCAPVAEDDVTAAGDGDSGARQPPPGEPVRPRRGRKSAAPARRGRPPGRPPALSPVNVASPPTAAAHDAEDADDPAEPPGPASPPATDASRVSCAGLPVSEPLALSDVQRLLEVPSKRRQRPCPFCGSLTGCSPPDSAEEHSHAPVTSVSPRRRLRVIVDGTAPTDGSGGRRQLNLSDQDGGRVAVNSMFRRRGRRRAGSDGSSGSQDLECHTCGKVMLSMSRLKKHQLVHTDERPFHCDRCPKCFKSVHVLNAHQLTHINYRPFRCDLCHQTFAKKWTLRGHMSTHDRSDGSDSLTCSTCGCEFQDRSTYDSHVKLHTGERKWECKVCHRGFAKKLKLRKHMVVHSQAMLHKCNLCDREFRWKEKLVKHVMLHTGERPFKCAEPRCTKSFRAHSDLNVHLRNVHKKQPKKLDYPIIKSDPKPNHCELLLMRVNEMDGIPPCDLCTKTFSSKDEYLNHIIPAHRDQEAYVCHPCKRVFDSKRVYEDHQEERHRRGEIMWRCQLCPKIFNKRSLFEGHKTLHATKFQCKICFRFASDERRLQAHIISHRYTDIDNSSHACTICCRQFKLRFSLKNHMFKMHSIDLPSLRKPPMRKFECSICHARFVRPTPAYNHMVRVHNIQPEPEVQDLFDLTNLSVEHPDVGAEGMNFPAVDPDDPSMQITALQNNIRIKVQAMAAQGMWDASEADGSTYLGGSAARRRQPARMAAGDASAAVAAVPRVAGGSTGAPPPPPLPPQQPPFTPQLQQQQHQLRPPPLMPVRPLQTPPPPSDDEPGKTLLRLSPGKRSQVVRVAGSPLPTPLSLLPPPPDRAGDGQRQQIIVIQQEGEEEIDLSRVLGGTAPSDAQTLTMNADGVLVDDQGNPVSLMVEGGGTATHLLEYLRGTEAPAAAAAARPTV